MGFPEITLMDGRRELVEAVQGGEETVAAASRRLGVTRATAYKWLRRYEQEGEDGLRNRSRRPRNSPRRTPAAIEEQVCGLRLLHPA